MGYPVVLIDWFCDPNRPRHSGMSDMIWAMAERMAALGDDVQVVAPYAQAAVGPTPVKVRTHPVPPGGYRNIAGHLLLALAARRTAGRVPGRPIIHAAEYLSTAVMAGGRAPVALTTPGNIFERIANVNHFDRSVTLVYKWAARRSAARCQSIIATSEEMRHWWAYSGAPPERMAVIPLGVDLGLFKPIPGARAHLGLDAGRPLVLFVGRLQAENGLETLIRAFPAVVAELRDAQLHVVGSGPDLARMERLAAELGVAAALRWHSWVPQERLPLYYAAADVFCLPRLSRVTPRVLFHAMACGAPIVTTDIGGISEFVRQRESGLLVPPRQPAALAGALAEALRDRELAARMGAAALAMAREQLSWDVVVRRIRDEAYARVAGGA